MDFGFDFDGFDFDNEATDVTEGTATGTDSFGGDDDWGTSLSSFFDAPVKKKKEAPAKKDSKASTKKAASSTASKGKDEDVTLPVTILARGFKTKVEGSGTMKLSEIGKKLIEDGYSQFLIPGMALGVVKAANVIYVCDSGVKGVSDDTQVDLSDDKKITVIDGLLTATFSADEFANKDIEEITAKDVAERFAQVNPAYEGCKISYTPGCEYAYPVFDSYEYAQEINFPVSVMLGGESMEYEEEDDNKLKAFKDKVFGCLPTGLTGNLCKTVNNGAYVASFSAYGAYQVAQGAKGSSSQPAKVEQKYTLPMELYIVTFNSLYSLTPEQFGGKEKVTLQEITTYMSESVSMFKDKSRKIDSLYNKEMNRLAVMFVSGSKGCELIRSKEELEECRKKDQFHGVYPSSEGTVKLRALPHGNFYSLMGKGRDLCTMVSMSFERKLPKIPGELLYSIIEYFREDLEYEAMVRVVYNKEKGEFSYYKAGGTRGKAYLSYEFAASDEYMSPNMIQVMEIHSHNTMSAFFSAIDDMDESDFPGVFGVIGHLDRQTPSMKFRAGVDGMFKELSVEELFDYKI